MPLVPKDGRNQSARKRGQKEGPVDNISHNNGSHSACSLVGQEPHKQSCSFIISMSALWRRHDLGWGKYENHLKLLYHCEYRGHSLVVQPGAVPPAHLQILCTSGLWT